jgi:hypothetical protein
MERATPSAELPPPSSPPAKRTRKRRCEAELLRDGEGNFKAVPTLSPTQSYTTISAIATPTDILSATTFFAAIISAAILYAFLLVARDHAGVGVRAGALTRAGPCTRAGCSPAHCTVIAAVIASLCDYRPPAVRSATGRYQKLLYSSCTAFFSIFSFIAFPRNLSYLFSQ